MDQGYHSPKAQRANRRAAPDSRSPPPGDSPISVVVAFALALNRGAIVQVLEGQSGIEVLATAATADDTLSACARSRPSVLLLDLELPGRPPIETVGVLSIRSPETRVILIGPVTHDRLIKHAIEANVAGFLTNQESPECLVAAIRSVARGGRSFSAEVQDRLVYDDNQHPTTARSRLDEISPRELETLRYIAQGLSKKQIASQMHISVKTVDNHTTSLMGKLDVHDRVQLTRLAIREGLVEL